MNMSNVLVLLMAFEKKSRPDPWLGLMAISDFSDHTSRILGMENLQSFCRSLNNGVRCKKVAHLL